MSLGERHTSIRCKTIEAYPNGLSSTLGYYLHPSIHSRLPKSPVIADVATGTGAFLLDLAKELPESAELFGFDISNALFPRGELPPNVRLHVCDAKKPFPVEFHGRFDAVHLRLMIPAMDDGDWKLVTENVYSLLKPGGAIQWTEGNFSQFEPAFRGSTSPDKTADNLNNSVQQWMDLPNFNWRKRLNPPITGWYVLPRIYREIGLEAVANDAVSSDRLGEEARKLATEIVTGVLETSFRMAGWSQSQIEETLRPARSDTDKGAYVRWDIHVIRGWKPKS